MRGVMKTGNEVMQKVKDKAKEVKHGYAAELLRPNQCKTRRRKIEAVYGILEAHHRAMQLPSTLIINEVSHPDEEIE